jgi:hypothetical protein
MPEPVDVFISYSPKDAELRAELEDHLMALKRKGVIRIWHDQLVGPGQDWRAISDEHLRSARVILLLISSNFFGSDNCYEVEMRSALERSRRGEACVIPILLRAYDLTDTPFARLRMLPEGQIPVTSPPWANHHEAWENVARGIREAILTLERGTTVAPMDAPPWEGAPGTRLVVMGPPVEPRSHPWESLASGQVAPTALQIYHPSDPALTPVPSSPFGADSFHQRQSPGPTPPREPSAVSEPSLAPFPEPKIVANLTLFSPPEPGIASGRTLAPSPEPPAVSRASPGLRPDRRSCATSSGRSSMRGTSTCARQAQWCSG